jgi:DNA polymerase-1
LSCAEPNLQNIKRPDPKDPESKMCRDVFVAPPGCELIELDYSQLELRIATMLSGDQVMAEIWHSGVDYHLKTAQLIAPMAWGIKAEEVTDAERSQAKTVNFAVMYGMRGMTLAKNLGVSVNLAEKILEAVKGAFKVFSKWCDAQITEARKTGYVWTWWDGQRARRRPLWDIASADPKLRNTAENGAYNTPVQGTASEYCLASLVACVRWIKENNIPAKLVLTVHDSLMFEVKLGHGDMLITQVREIMTSWSCTGPGGAVKLVADAKRGPSWGSLKNVE